MSQLSQQVRRQSSLQFNQDAIVTERQLQVLGLVHEGFTNEEISERLFVSVGTVKNHVHRILDVLQTSSRQQAAEFYRYLHKPTVAA